MNFVDCRWPSVLSAIQIQSLSQLIYRVNQYDPIIGFSHDATLEQIQIFFEQLNNELQQQKKYLMMIHQETDASLIGMMILQPNTSPNNRHIADMGKGMIDPKQRGQGVLYQAFYQIAAKSEQLAIDLLTLDVRAGATAETIWQKCGFIEFGRLEDYARDNGTIYAGVYMKQSVQELKRKMEQYLSLSV